jgi:hypothetical protein
VKKLEKQLADAHLCLETVLARQSQEIRDMSAALELVLKEFD